MNPKVEALGMVAALIVACVCPASLQSAEIADTMVLPAARPEELTPANGWPSQQSYDSWTRSLGGPTSNRFSTLRQIDRTNVAQLQPAWTYHSQDGQENIECNPILVDGKMLTPTPGNNIVAIDAETGKEVWRFHPEQEGQRREDHPARRGLLYWAGAGGAAARIIFPVGDWVYALDPKTGTPVESFGDKGRTALPTGGSACGAVWKNILVMPGFNGDVFGYDVASGALLWRFYTIPRPGEFGAETWSSRDDGANCWGGMALDESRGIAYIATGSPKPNFHGEAHLGDNLFANCVIALEVATGKRLWHFQEIRHDIWDLDIPAPPNLVTVMHDGRRVDAVAQVTKLGNTLLLDRVTGKPLFPFRLRRAPAAFIPGEVTAPYQPDVELPEPFARQFTFPDSDITDRTPAAHAFVEKLLAGRRVGWFEPFEVLKPAAYYGIDGGGEWVGAAFDPATGRLYVSANETPWLVRFMIDDDPPLSKTPTPGQIVYVRNCSACHGPERRGNGPAPSLAGLHHRMTDEQVLALWKTGRNLMPPAPPMTDVERKELLDFLMGRDRPPVPVDPKAPPRYAHLGTGRLVDNEGYPGCKPPWGTLNCLDLNTGKLVWKVPLGEYDELTKAGIPKTGTESFGGAMVTASGLVICSGTLDNKIRAFDADTGAELWAAGLPAHGSAPPITYEINGRQYLVIPATGGGKIGGPVSDAWVAFALPVKPHH